MEEFRCIVSGLQVVQQLLLRWGRFGFCSIWAVASWVTLLGQLGIEFFPAQRPGTFSFSHLQSVSTEFNQMLLRTAHFKHLLTSKTPVQRTLVYLLVLQ